MGVRIGLLFLLVLGINWFYVDGRSLLNSDVAAMQVNFEESKNEIEASHADAKDDRVCTLCQQYTSQARDYLGENKTQRQIIDDLHLACSHLHSYKKECITLVDYYAPLFFIEIAKVEPEDFCNKFNLCEEMEIASQNGCSLCHEAVAEVVAKLDDPDTQIEIIQILLKACDQAENYAKKCKRLVFEYGPIILANAEKFLTKNDICSTIHACNATTYGNEVESSSMEIPLLSES